MYLAGSLDCYRYDFCGFCLVLSSKEIYAGVRQELPSKYAARTSELFRAKGVNVKEWDEERV